MAREKRKNKVLVKKVKRLHDKVRRQKKSIVTLQSLVSELKKQNLLQSEPATVIEQCFDDKVIDIITNELKNSGRASKGRRYSQSVKQFAVTLHYYSPQAYDYCHKILSLPHPSALRHWISNIECEPGFLTNVFEECSRSDVKDFSLVIDSMSLMKGTHYSNGKYSGFCDYGGLIAEDPDKLATEALVFLLVPLRYSKMQYPVGFFLVDKVSSDIQARLVQNILGITSEKGIRIRNITCDGAAANLAMFAVLGANLNLHEPQPFFCHPNLGYNVYATLDICHMLKLCRNALADFGTFRIDDEEISWEFFSRLSKLQDELGLHFANKLSSQHISWQKQKMKVKLAAQTLSRSVSDAMSFLQESGVEGFQDCSATVEFIRQVGFCTACVLLFSNIISFTSTVVCSCCYMIAYILC